MVRFQQPAQTFDADDVTLMALMLGLDDPVEALVSLFVMIVLEILGQRVAQLFLGGEDEMVETFLLDGPDKPFRTDVEIGTSRPSFQ